MLIDWFTVGAQALNFIILVWLLKRFLYKPVLRALDAREKHIAQALADADRRTAEAQTAREKLQAESSAFADQRAALLVKATLDATAEGKRLLDDARRAAESLTSKQKAALDGETAALSDRLAGLAAAESINIARAALKDLAGVDLEERICEVFARRLRELEPKARDSFGISIEHSAGQSVVASSFELSDGQKAAIQTAINETFSADVPLRFQASSQGLGGIELTAGGQRLSWTIADYLRTLEGKVAGLLKMGSLAAGVSAGPTLDNSAAPVVSAPASPAPPADEAAAAA